MAGADERVRTLKPADCRYIEGDVREGSWDFCRRERYTLPDGSFPSAYCIVHMRLCIRPAPPMRWSTAA